MHTSFVTYILLCIYFIFNLLVVTRFFSNLSFPFKFLNMSVIEQSPWKKSISSLYYHLLRTYGFAHLNLFGRFSTDNTIRVLDLCCGWSTHTRKFFQVFDKMKLEYDGIDSSEYMIDNAIKTMNNDKSGILNHVHFYLQDARTPDQWPHQITRNFGQYDLVTCQNALSQACSYYIDLVQIFKAASNAMSSNALFVVSIIDEDIVRKILHDESQKILQRTNSQDLEINDTSLTINVCPSVLEIKYDKNVVEKLLDTSFPAKMANPNADQPQQQFDRVKIRIMGAKVFTTESLIFTSDVFRASVEANFSVITDMNAMAYAINNKQDRACFTSEKEVQYLLPLHRILVFKKN